MGAVFDDQLTKTMLPKINITGITHPLTNVDVDLEHITYKILYRPVIIKLRHNIADKSIGVICFSLPQMRCGCIFNNFFGCLTAWKPNDETNECSY